MNLVSKNLMILLEFASLNISAENTEGLSCDITKFCRTISRKSNPAQHVSGMWQHLKSERFILTFKFTGHKILVSFTVLSSTSVTSLFYTYKRKTHFQKEVHSLKILKVLSSYVFHIRVKKI